MRGCAHLQKNLSPQGPTSVDIVTDSERLACVSLPRLTAIVRTCFFAFGFSVQTFRIEGNVSSITNLAVSPSEDQLALTTSNNQIYR